MSHLVGSSVSGYAALNPAGNFNFITELATFQILILLGRSYRYLRYIRYSYNSASDNVHGIYFSVCGTSHLSIVGKNVTDYVVHHEPFQYYQSTPNRHHLPPNSTAMIGHSDQANHQYDLSYFWAAAQTNNLPAVSYLKASHYQDGHPGVSDPIDEQHFLVNTIAASTSNDNSTIGIVRILCTLLRI